MQRKNSLGVIQAFKPAFKGIKNVCVLLNKQNKTFYSGSLEYCEANYSWLVDAKSQYLAESDYIFVLPGQKCADPDLNHAAEIFRYTYENPEKSDTRAKNSKE